RQIANVNDRGHGVLLIKMEALGPHLVLLIEGGQALAGFSAGSALLALAGFSAGSALLALAGFSAGSNQLAALVSSGTSNASPTSRSDPKKPGLVAITFMSSPPYAMRGLSG